MDTKAKIVAPCGISCFNCEVYSGNITKEIQDRLSDFHTNFEIGKGGCDD